MDEVASEAATRKVELVVLPTPQAIAEVNKAAAETNAILHVTC